MKKTHILTLALIIIYSNSFCQLEKKTWLVGGGISYSQTSYKSLNYGTPYKTYNINVKPNIGYFVIDKLAFGINSNINKIKNENLNLFYTDFNIGPYARYYFLNPTKNVNILAEVAYQVGYDFATASNKLSKNTFTFSGGPVIYFNTTVGLEFLINYSANKFNNISGTNSIITAGIGLQVHLIK
jgi:hypothetical protein